MAPLDNPKITLRLPQDHNKIATRIPEVETVHHGDIAGTIRELQAAHREAMRLLANPLIATYIRKLQSAHRQRHNVTVDALTHELEEARFAAMVFGVIGAAVSATMGKAKLHGLITEHVKVNGLEALKALSNEELIERFRGIVASISNQAPGARR